MNVIYYVEVNLMCILLLLLFGNLFFHKLEQQPNIKIIFSGIIISAILFCVSDMIAGVLRGRMFFGARTLITISNWLYYEMLAVISCLWLFYVSLKLNHNFTLSRKKILLYSLPLILYTLIALTNFFSGFLFTINEQNLYVRGQGIFFHWLLTWGYFLVATIKTVSVFVKEKSKIKKNEIRPLMYFMIAPTIAAVIQMLFYGVTSTQVGITLSIVMICIAGQNAQILTDPLTGLNNRRGLEHFFDHYLSHISEQPLTLVMLDLNGFKKINDTYGHLMGDQALTAAASLLKNVCREIPSRLFLCRYGGDEFLLAGFLESDASLQQLKQSIHDACEQIFRRGELPFPLKVSIGSASAVCRNNSELEQLLCQADTAMYIEKKKMQENGTTKPAKKDR